MNFEDAHNKQTKPGPDPAVEFFLRFPDCHFEQTRDSKKKKKDPGLSAASRVLGLPPRVYGTVFFHGQRLSHVVKLALRAVASYSPSPVDGTIVSRSVCQPFKE